MKQIDVKKPKYIIPAIILPFILFLGYMAIDMMKSKEVAGTKMDKTTSFNQDIPEANLEDKETSTKFGALQDAYNKSSDFSSIQTIDKEQAVNEVDDNEGSLYSSKEMRRIDSINQVTALKQKEVNKQIEKYRSGDYSSGEADRGGSRKAPAKAKMSDDMAVFREQMNYMDSIQNPKPRNSSAATAKRQTKKNVDTDTEQTLEVVKAANPAASYFNTVGKKGKTSLITAILDETIKVTEGSRVRVRLLDDIMLNDAVITKGSYLYGNVSSFKSQRVSINITSIMIDSKRLKVDLSIFDTDGQEGLFVPASSFRDLGKEVGGQLGSQTVQMDQETGAIEQFAYGALQDVYKSTSQAITKNIKKNKAYLKYSAHVYLVNNKEKK